MIAPPESEMSRVHKLLVMVGEDGVVHESRDFKKLTQVVVNEVLPEAMDQMEIADLVVTCLKRIPLKHHLYAGLTVAMARSHSDLVKKMLQNVVLQLESSVNAGRVYESCNIIAYLAELMNFSFVNSLGFLNLLEDIAAGFLRAQNLASTMALTEILARTMPVYAYSAHQKIFHEFSQLINRIRKQADSNRQLSQIIADYDGDRIVNKSSVGRLQVSFEDVTQLTANWKLTISPKGFTELPEYYPRIADLEDPAYQAFYLCEGFGIRNDLEALIDAFLTNERVLLLKIIKYLAGLDPMALRVAAEVLIYKSIKAQSFVCEIWVLLALVKERQTNEIEKHVRNTLFRLYAQSQSFDLTQIVAFSKILAFIVNNWKQPWNWSSYIEQAEGRDKLDLLLHLAIERLTLLNYNIELPPGLGRDKLKSIANEQDYNDADQLETFESFEELLKTKSPGDQVVPLIRTEMDYTIFLEVLFRRTSLSETHLKVLIQRYQTVFVSRQQDDWALINKIRNFWKNSYFHRLLYMRHVISKGFVTYRSYVKYIGELKDKSSKEMLWVKLQLNELNQQFGSTSSKTK